MLIRPITYTDLDGTEVTENFHFNLTLSEVAELETDMPGGFSEYLLKVVTRKDAKSLLAAYKKIIAFAYGERSDDGRYFLKEDKGGYSLGRLFLQHPAYNALFLEMMGEDSDDEAFMTFLTGCLPKDVVEKLPSTADIPELLEKRRNPSASMTSVSQKETEEKTAIDYTRDQLLAMSDEEFDKVAGTEPLKMAESVLQVAFQRRNQKKASE